MLEDVAGVDVTVDAAPVRVQPQWRPRVTVAVPEAHLVTREHRVDVVVDESLAAVLDDRVGIGRRDEQRPLRHCATLPTNIIPSPIER